MFINSPTAFEWDSAKAESNLVKHGDPFSFAARIFLDIDLVVENATRREDGEDRFKTIGRIDGKLYAVVCTLRGDVCRIISARRTNSEEDGQYGR